MLGRALGHALVRHGIAPPNFAVTADWMPAAAAIGGGVVTALLAVLAAGRRAARVPPTLALTDAAVEPRLLGPGRIIGGLLALAGAVPLFTVSTTTTRPETAAATSEMTRCFSWWRSASSARSWRTRRRRLLAPPLAALSPVGGFLASANLGAATRRFSSASTPLVLTVAMSCTLLFSTTTIDHAVAQQRQAALTGQLAITSAGPGIAAAALADVRATPGVRSAVALTPTTLGPSLGASDDTIPAQILDRRAGRRARRRRDRRLADAPCTVTRSRSGATAPTPRTPTSATAWRSCSATAPAPTPRSWRSTRRDLAFGDALLAPELAAGHQTTPLLGTILIRTDQPGRRRPAAAGAGRGVSRAARQRPRIARHRSRRRP